MVKYRVVALAVIAAALMACAPREPARISSSAGGLPPSSTSSDLRHPTTDPLNRPPGTWVVISGVVQDKAGDSFILDSGSHDVRVEVDGHDLNGENTVRVGDRVTVHGVVDHDFVERPSIAAARVYVDRLDSFIYASAEAEKRGETIFGINPPKGWVSMRGIIRDLSVSGFTLQTGNYSIRVDTSGLARYRNSSTGLPALAEGDPVIVNGTMDDSEHGKGHEIDARSISRLVAEP